MSIKLFGVVPPRLLACQRLRVVLLLVCVCGGALVINLLLVKILKAYGFTHVLIIVDIYFELSYFSVCRTVSCTTT